MFYIMRGASPSLYLQGHGSRSSWMFGSFSPALAFIHISTCSFSFFSLDDSSLSVVDQFVGI